MSNWHPQRIRAARAECRIRMAYCAVVVGVVVCLVKGGWL